MNFLSLTVDRISLNGQLIEFDPMRFMEFLTFSVDQISLNGQMMEDFNWKSS